MKCFGRNLDDHCCYIAGKPCPFLGENVEKGFRWSCKLLLKHGGDWTAAINDPQYNTGKGSPGYAFRNTPYKNCRDFQCKECAVLEAGKITQIEFEAIKIP